MLSLMLSDSPIPGVNTVNGMIGISADCSVRRHVFRQPYQAVQQRFERIGADHRQRSVYRSDGGIDYLGCAFVEGVGGFVCGVFKPMLALVYPPIGTVVAGVWDAQEGRFEVQLFTVPARHRSRPASGTQVQGTGCCGQCPSFGFGGVFLDRVIAAVAIEIPNVHTSNILDRTTVISYETCPLLTLSPTVSFGGSQYPGP